MVSCPRSAPAFNAAQVNIHLLMNAHLNRQHLSYPDGFTGDSACVDSLATFFNKYFNPHTTVSPSHLAVAPGAASSLDALLYNICEAGDGVLVPGPFWNAFDWLFNVRSGVQPVAVNVDSIKETFTTSLISAMAKVLENPPRPIKALILTNPQNPFGQCYPTSVIEECIKFCHERGIHFVSDEVYALSSFSSDTFPDPVPFVSALSIDVEGLGCDPSRVHVVWSVSKDLGSSGFRLVSSPGCPR